MKLLFKFIALASILVAGCAKMTPESGTDVSREELLPMTFSASALEEPEVKAEIAGLDIKWSTGDEIGIYDGTAVRRFTLKSGAGTTSGVFEGEAAKAEKYIAVYPYNDGIAVDSEDRISGLSIPRIQAAGACPVMMTAKCEDGGNAFAFKNALAYVKVTPGFNCHKIVLETYEPDGDGDWQGLCGDVEIASDSARVVGNPCSHVILSGEIISGNPCCIGVAPKRLDKGFKLIFDDAVNEVDVFDNGLQYARKSSKTPDLLRGHVLNLGRFDKESTEWTEKAVDLVSFEKDGPDSGQFDDRAIYDWKDVNRIAASCEKTDTLKTTRMHFLEDIDYGGRLLYPELIHVKGASLHLCGNGHSIGNYVQGGMSVEERGRAGLFCVETLKSFCVEDLILCPKQFQVSGSGGISYGGAFASSIYCTESIRFKNCRVHGDISVECAGNYAVCAGGFVGIVEPHGNPDTTNETQPQVYMENCLMEGSVYAYSRDDDAYAGGFFGYVAVAMYDYICYITRCRNRADVTAVGNDDVVIVGVEAAAAGGIVGCDSDTGQDIAIRLNSCVNEGTIYAKALDNDNAFAGGMIGLHDSDGNDNPVEVHVHPYVHNCLNRGAITAISDDGKSGGMIGYCYDDDTSFRNCVDSGKLSGKVCAHISGTKGSYSGICYWTIADSLPGIHDKYDHGQYESGRMSGYKTDLSIADLHPEEGDAGWIMVDGHLDLDF
ncbi:MAG: fimbrillin family protein [Bacteroidales bacterium]|nr:fimbrillin family protein [Bacteroidales bacterium]